MAAQQSGKEPPVEDESKEDAAGAIVPNASRMGAPDGPPVQKSFPRITLDKIDANLFLAKPEHLWKPPLGRAVYGGQVLGQAVAAASQTVAPGLSLHSLHGYFVRAGQPQHPIVYDVKRIRDGTSFATRGVAAKQDGQWIFNMQASFHKHEFSSLDHQAKMPQVPAPETLLQAEQQLKELVAEQENGTLKTLMGKFAISYSQNQIEVRPVVNQWNYHSRTAVALDAKQTTADFGMPSNVIWFRAANRLPDDEFVHHAVLAYQSDANLLAACRSAVDPLKFFQARPMSASLDHAMWFHLPFPRWRADEWLLYVTYSPRLTGARGLATGHIYTREGLLVVSCTQEGLIRLGTDKDMPSPSSCSKL